MSDKLPLAPDTSGKQGDLHAAAGIRDTYWDGIKGVAIIAVIAIHVSTASGTFPIESANNAFGLYLRQFINFPVALFFFVSGLFSQPKRGGYYRARFARIVPPYLFWSAIYLAWALVAGQPVSLISVLDGTSIGVGYFVIVLLCLTLLAPLFWRMTSVMPWLLVFSAASLAFTYYFRLIDTSSLWSDFPYSALPFFVWAPFYLLGIQFRKWNVQPSQRAFCYSLAAVAALLVFSILEASVLHYDNRELAVSQVKLSSFLTSIAVICAVFHGQRTVTLDRFAWLGVGSYAIYLAHMFVLSRLRGLATGTAIFENQVAYTVLAVGFVLVAMIVMLWISHRLPKPVRSYLIGL